MLKYKYLLLAISVLGWMLVAKVVSMAWPLIAVSVGLYCAYRVHKLICSRC